MIFSLSKVLLIGEVGGDPEMRHPASGRAVATFSLAASQLTSLEARTPRPASAVSAPGG